MGEAVVKAPGGKMLRVKVEVAQGRLTSVVLTGDFFAYPEEVVEEMEKSLTGLPIDQSIEELDNVLREDIRRMDAVLVGVDSSQIAEAVARAAGR